MPYGLKARYAPLGIYSQGAPIYAKGPLWGNDSGPFLSDKEARIAPEGQQQYMPRGPSRPTTWESLCCCPYGAILASLPFGSLSHVVGRPKGANTLFLPLRGNDFILPSGAQRAQPLRLSARRVYIAKEMANAPQRGAKREKVGFFVVVAPKGPFRQKSERKPKGRLASQERRGTTHSTYTLGLLWAYIDKKAGSPEGVASLGHNICPKGTFQHLKVQYALRLPIYAQRGPFGANEKAFQLLDL